MAYPSPSDWNSAAPLSAWYVHRTQGGSNLCSSTGWDLLADLQEELQTRLSSSPAPTYDGTTVDGSNIPVNDPTLPARGWDLDLLKGLWAAANAGHAPQATLDKIAADARAGSIGPETLAAGIWIGQRYDAGTVVGTGTSRYGLGSTDEILIPAGTSLPNFGTAPPVPSNGERSSGARCNTAPADAASIQPIQQAVVPFQINGWVLLATLVVATGAAVALSRNVPTSRSSGGQQSRRTRRA